MIISHKHKYIFFAIPKTGTHSVRQALRQHMAEDDLEQVGLFVQKKFPFPEFKEISHGHITAQQIRPVIGEEIYATYRKFAFVRNPFDRFVSYCSFMSRETNHFKVDPKGFMKYVIRDLKPVQHLLFQPQYSFICDADRVLQTDFVGRNETMQNSFDAICDEIGMARVSLERVNSSVRRQYQDYYDPDLIGWVSDIYQRDLEIFNYRFE